MYLLIEENQAHNFSVGLQTSSKKMFPTRFLDPGHPNTRMHFFFMHLKERTLLPVHKRGWVSQHSSASCLTFWAPSVTQELYPRYLMRESPISTETNSPVFKWSHGGVSSITTKFWVGWPLSSISFVDPEHVCQDLSASPRGTETKLICIKNESNRRHQTKL